MFEAKILQLQDAKQIIEYEKLRMQKNLDDVERELLSWHASWREESLQHYLPLGWSFGFWHKETGQLSGYFIAQPLLFVRGLTQTLWVERLVGDDPMRTAELIEIAYKLCREKHFQKVLFAINDDAQVEQSVFQLTPVHDKMFELKTTKF